MNNTTPCQNCRQHSENKEQWPCLACHMTICIHCFHVHTGEKHNNLNVKKDSK